MLITILQRQNQRVFSGSGGVLYLENCDEHVLCIGLWVWWPILTFVPLLCNEWPWKWLGICLFCFWLFTGRCQARIGQWRNWVLYSTAHSIEYLSMPKLSQEVLMPCDGYKGQFFKKSPFLDGMHAPSSSQHTGTMQSWVYESWAVCWSSPPHHLFISCQKSLKMALGALDRARITTTLTKNPCSFSLAAALNTNSVTQPPSHVTGFDWQLLLSLQLGERQWLELLRLCRSLDGIGLRQGGVVWGELHYRRLSS